MLQVLFENFMEFLNETVQVMSFCCPKIGWLTCPTHQPMGSGLNLELLRLTPRWLEKVKDILPNSDERWWCFFHGRIRKKWPTKHIQDKKKKIKWYAMISFYLPEMVFFFGLASGNRWPCIHNMLQTWGGIFAKKLRFTMLPYQKSLTLFHWNPYL